jgi:hypothetical protein
MHITYHVAHSTVGTHTVYPTGEHADEVVAQLQTDDNDWDYLVVLDPTGKAVIAVFDEEHHYLGLL